jgi:hypothetical protein
LTLTPIPVAAPGYPALAAATLAARAALREEPAICTGSIYWSQARLLFLQCPTCMYRWWHDTECGVGGDRPNYNH